MNKWTVIQFIAIILIVTSVVVLLQFYYNSENQSCRDNPLVYAAEFMEDKYGYAFMGQGVFIMEGGSPIIFFSKQGISMYNPNRINNNIDNVTINNTIQL